MDVPQDFVPKIVGGQLVRVRSQTVYYILTRMKSVCKVWLNRERAAADFGGRISAVAKPMADRSEIG
jgi:cysteine desulfuration protein SufE